MNNIVNFSIITIITIIGEFILLSIIDNANNSETKSGLRKISKVLFIFITLLFSLLFAIFCVVTFSAFRNGQILTGIKMVLSTIIVGVGIYYLFIRKISLRV